MKQQNTTTTTTFKNPNWPEANQLAIYKCSWEVEPGTTRNKFSEGSERVFNPGSPDLKASTLTTGPHCLLYHVREERTSRTNSKAHLAIQTTFQEEARSHTNMWRKQRYDYGGDKGMATPFPHPTNTRCASRGADLPRRGSVGA